MRTDLENGIDTRQTYEEYLETTKAYHFIPLKREGWQNWQVHYHGSFRPSEPEVGNELE